MGKRRTLAAKESGQLPQLGHVESLKDLALVAGAVAVQDDGALLAAGVLVGKGQTGTDGDLRTDDTVAAIEVLREHVHGTTLAVCDALAATEQLANDGADGGAAHQGVAVASVGGDDIVFLADGMLDANGDGLLAGGKMAETSDLLLLVQPVGGHLHLSVALSVRTSPFDDRSLRAPRGNAYRVTTMS